MSDDGEVAMRERAIALAGMGFRVFKLQVGGKLPAVPAFYDVASSDLDEVRAMFTDPASGESLDNNIAISTDDLLVVDVDVKDGQVGAQSLENLIDVYGLDTNTLEAVSPTGSRHLYYRPPPGERARQRISDKKIGKNIDIKGFHNYVVAPGSVIGEQRYHWFDPTKEIIEAQPWLMKLCSWKAPKANGKAASFIAQDDDLSIAHAVNWLRTDAPEATQGARGDWATFKIACRLKDFGLSQMRALEILILHWNEFKAHPPWGFDELEQKVANAYSYGRMLPPGAASSTADFVDSQQETSNATDSDKLPQRYPLIPFDRLRTNTTVSYLVKGLMPRVGVGVLWGPPKCGKSFWMLELALHIALGRAYRGRRVTQGAVVYCAFEGASGYGARADALRQHHSVPDGPIPLQLMPARLDLTKGYAKFIAAVRAQSRDVPALIVLDTLNRSFVGSESSDEDMSAYFRAADALREAFGCFVQIIHHCGIDGTRPRGHTSLTAGADAQLAQTRVGDDLTTMVEFMRDGPEGELVESRLVTLTIGTDADGDPITSCVTIPRNDFNAPIELTTLEKQWMEALILWDAEETDRREDAGEQEKDILNKFDWKLVKRIIFSEGVRAQGVSKGLSRTRVVRNVQGLCEKGWIKKVGPGQWVIP